MSVSAYCVTPERPDAVLTLQIRLAASMTAFDGTMTLLAAKTQPTPEKLSLDPHTAMRTLC